MSTFTNAVRTQSFRAKINSKGLITIPVEIRRSEGISPGDYICFELPPDHNNLPVRYVTMSLCKKSSKNEK
jgi:AbrB family looped-hinge helix DNA binding protein